MPVSSPIPRQPVGRTFAIAISVLGLVALVQVMAVGWAVASRLKNPTDRGMAANSGAANGSFDGEGLNLSDPFEGGPNSPGGRGAQSSTPIMPPPKPLPVPSLRTEQAPE